MNFLSHYYFDRNVSNCYHILGTVLPDLLKNADKTIVLHPDKYTHGNAEANSILEGWHNHMAVDRYFHSSDFFLRHSHQLKKALLPAIQGSAVKPFFLGHIALELILDNLLITTGKVSVDAFYAHLTSCNDDLVAGFLAQSGLRDTGVFFKFFDKFKDERYLQTYAETPRVAYALKRVCMRIWPAPFTPQQEAGMNEVIISYRLSLINVFMDIFDEIEAQIS